MSPLDTSDGVAYEIVASESDRSAWLAARHDLIGASDVGNLFSDVAWVEKKTGKPYKSRAEVLASKATRGKCDEYIGNKPPIYWGHALEPVILDAYMTGFVDWRCPEIKVRLAYRWNALLRSRQYPYLGASPDAILGHGVIGDCKSAHPNSGWLNDAKPKQTYVYQLTQQMIVTGARVAYLLVFCGTFERIRVWRVDFDGAIAQRIIDEGARFWRDVEMARKLEEVIHG